MLVRIDMNQDDCKRLALAWKSHWGDMSMCSYYHHNFKSNFAEVHPSKLRFIIAGFKPIQHDLHEFQHTIRLINSICVLTGTCNFIGRGECHVRVCAMSNSRQRSHVVEIYIFESPNGELLAHILFHLQHGKADYKYSPLIVESQEEELQSALMEILTSKKQIAARTIQLAWLRAKYNPDYLLCMKLLLQDLSTITI